MKIVSIVGARPQLVKAATVSPVLRRSFAEVLVHTGQHYDYAMSDVFIAELGIPTPEHNLGVGSGSHGVQTGQMLERIEAVLLAERPDIVLVYGDTNSTLAGALAAAKLGIPIAHVEAGLRSFVRTMPEEINRVVADHLSELLLCPTETAIANLRREGITAGVYNCGDVMYDAVLQHAPVAAKRSTVLREHDLTPGEYVLTTVHRAENTDAPERLRGILTGLSLLGRPVLFPIHPRTRPKLAEADATVGPNVKLVAPVGYLDMLALERSALLVATDSGGVQKEAYFLGVPCATLREETEWPETLTGGWNVLVGSDPERLAQALDGASSLRRSPPPRPPVFGDGAAAEAIGKILSGWSSRRPRGDRACPKSQRGDRPHSGTGHLPALPTDPNRDRINP
ncbi:MAG: UDP-N-acetylglucosamine 2-epimerase (non-hydrolyzing) [Chloroflexi bacterium]|nr:UDP-N-acetylglucosamine 2-epimerase (non-hydrolyzing) [Chloroflexota bacterium]